MNSIKEKYEQAEREYLKHCFDSRIQIIDDSLMRQSKRTSLNRVCDISDWRAHGTDFQRVLREQNEFGIFRKAWEYALCISGLEQLGVVHQDNRAISVGAGIEKPLYYFANKIKEMVATDLYECSEPGYGGKEMVRNPKKFAPFPYREDHLTVLEMDATHLGFPDNSFDFCFSLSSIEHFGSRENQKKAMQEIFRVLKPNGIVSIATEIILSRASHPEYFRVEELEEIILRSTELKLIGGEIDYRISRSLVLNPFNLEKEKDILVCPHIVLKYGDVIWTSIMVFLRKNY
jgi:SAM-dependent methyltransferase